MDKQMKGSSLKKIGALLPWLWLAAGYVLDIWFQLVPGKWIVDSDLASEMMLTKILNQEGSILSHSWYYSTELRVVNMQWFYRLGLLLFPDDWHLARTFGMAIALLVFIAAALLLAKGIGLGSLGPWMVGALIWPFGMRYLVYAMYGGYYLIHMLLPMLTLALVFCSIHAQNRRPKVLCAVLACLAALGAGLNGVKVLMVFQAPFLLATMLLAVMALNSCGKTTWKDACRTCGTEMQLLAGALYTTVAAMAGYVINAKILAKSYSFKSFGGVTWSRPRDGLFELQRIIVDYFHEFGYTDGVGVFHFSGIASGLGLLIGIWLAFCIVRLLFRYRSLAVAERFMVLLLCSMIAVCGIAFSYFQEYSQYFWFPSMPAAFAVIAIEIKTEKLHLPGERRTLAFLLAGALSICGINTVRQQIEHPALGRIGIDKVAYWLVDNGYSEGYATFWNGGCMTEITSGKLDIWYTNLRDDYNEGWLQPDYHLTRDPEKPFILIDTETDGPVDEVPLVQHGGCTEVYNDGRYVVYAYDSAEAMHAASDAEHAKTNENQNSDQ